MVFHGQSANGAGFSPVMSVFPLLYNSTNPTYWNTIHLSLMLYDVSNLQYLKIQIFCEVTRCQWACRSAYFEGTTILWIVTHYAISDTVSHPTRLICLATLQRETQTLPLTAMLNQTPTYLTWPTYCHSIPDI